MLEKLKKLGGMPMSFQWLSIEDVRCTAHPMARRTIHKLTRWHEDEWRRIADAARPLGMPPLRFVREAALEKAAKGGALALPARPPRRRTGDELLHQICCVMNNLQQLQRVALDDWADEAAARTGRVLEVGVMAARSAPARAAEAAAVLAVLVPAGVALNELAHSANATGACPPDAEVLDVLATVEAALRRSWIHPRSPEP